MLRSLFLASASIHSSAAIKNKCSLNFIRGVSIQNFTLLDCVRKFENGSFIEERSYFCCMNFY